MEPGQFEGRIGRYHWESEPWWPEPVRPPEGAPNVLVVLLDDVGFAQFGCYGSDIATPTIDRLAAAGLRFTNFHTTALCSPTRACVLTGRNHHSVGMGRIIDLSLGFPGYDATISHTNGFVSEMLGAEGYAAYAVGKWHLTPAAEHHLAADRRRWPLGRGFQRYYGFFDGETNQFAPALIHDNHQVAPPGGYEDGYHFTTDIVDRAIEYLTDLRNVDPDLPFFCYVAPGACHSPHQAPPEWIERYRGAFDAGWDVWRERAFARQMAEGLLPPTTELSPRPDWVPAWDDLTPDQQRVSARYMEAFAGFLSHTDAELGRLIDFLDTTGDLQNTLVMVLSDNGASSEGGAGGSLNDVRHWNLLDSPLDEALDRLDEIGGPRIHNNYPWGWTVAGNTPFRRWKREVHEGGVADPLVIHWPAGMGRPGETRHQYVHAIDLTPTVLEAAGVPAPEVLGGVPQRPLEGASFLACLTDADAPSPRTTQYYEMLGCRAIHHEGWKAVTYHPIQSDEPGLGDDAWELYDVTVDPSECHDLAAEHPERLAELIERWWAEAERHQVLPVDNRPFSEFTTSRPDPTRGRTRFVLRPGGGMIPEACSANIKNRTHSVVASVEVAEGEVPSGVLASQGSYLGGWALYVDDGDLVWHLNNGTRRFSTVRSPVTWTAGPHELAVHYRRTDEFVGDAVLTVDDVELAREPVRFYGPTRFSMTGIGLTIGRADPLPVSDDPGAGRPWSATLQQVVITLDGPPHHDPDADAHHAIATQ